MKIDAIKIQSNFKKVKWYKRIYYKLKYGKAYQFEDRNGNPVEFRVIKKSEWLKCKGDN